MHALVKTQIGQLRIIGFLEGVSFLVLLCIAMPLKYVYQQPMAVQVTGMLHGILFILYIFYVLINAFQKSWSYQTTSLALIASLVPFGTFYVDARIFSKN